MWGRAGGGACGAPRADCGFVAGPTYPKAATHCTSCRCTERGAAQEAQTPAAQLPWVGKGQEPVGCSSSAGWAAQHASHTPTRSSPFYGSWGLQGSPSLGLAAGPRLQSPQAAPFGSQWWSLRVSRERYKGAPRLPAPSFCRGRRNHTVFGWDKWPTVSPPLGAPWPSLRGQVSGSSGCVALWEALWASGSPSGCREWAGGSQAATCVGSGARCPRVTISKGMTPLGSTAPPADRPLWRTGCEGWCGKRVQR